MHVRFNIRWLAPLAQDDLGAQAEAAVAHLSDLFPEYSADALWCTLESNGYDVAAAADELCQLEAELASQWRPPEPQQQPQEDKVSECCGTRMRNQEMPRLPFHASDCVCCCGTAAFVLMAMQAAAVAPTFNS